MTGAALSTGSMINRRWRLLSHLLCLMLGMSQVDQAMAAPCPATLPGSNVAGGEFNPGKLPGVPGQDYVFPAGNEVALLQRLGLRLMRVPVLWERLQPTPLETLDVAELDRLDQVVRLARSAGLTVVLDVHNYGAYRGVPLDRPGAPAGALPDLWARLARHFADDDTVVFGLMNEPKDFDPVAWAAIAKATLGAIRATGARNVVLVPGSHWDGAHSWFDDVDGHSNAQALLPLAQGDDRVVFEVHQYFDDDYSGTKETCGAAGKVPAALSNVATWARRNHVRVMLGEFGVSQRPECVKALDDALAVIERDRDVWYGWTYWAAGAWWGNYPFNIEASGGDTPQAKVLRARAGASRASRCEATP